MSITIVVEVPSDMAEDFRKALRMKRLQDIDPMDYCPNILQSLSLKKLECL